MKHESSDQKRQIGLFSLSSFRQNSQINLNSSFMPVVAALVVAPAACCL